jgi:hypothetical protein
MDSGFNDSRDRHLFGPGPKRILSLGGSGNSGVSAAIFLAFLERLETILSETAQRQIRLGDYFDLVGGTSIGAVTAAAIAMGYGVSQLKDFFVRFTPLALKSLFWRVPLLQPRFDARRMRAEIHSLVGDRLLDTSDLITGFCLVTKRLDTGSPWIISNNPRAAFWQDGQDYIGNKSYPLVNLLRASMAAPHYFDPELLPVSQEKSRVADVARAQENVPLPLRAIRTVMDRFGLARRPEAEYDPNVFGLFVDGTVSPHGNPSLALLQMATLRPFALNWPTDPEHLIVCSIGAGRRQYLLPHNSIASSTMNAIALGTLISDAEDTVLSQMQYFGECPAPWGRSETGISSEDAPLGGKLCRFFHYDVELTQDWIKDELGETMSSVEISRLHRLDDPAIFMDLHRIAQLAAEKQLRPEHFNW